MKWIASKAGFDEVFGRPSAPRTHYASLISILESFTLEDVARRERLQRLALMNQGITFTVYGEKDGLERIFPFDFVPRIIPAELVFSRREYKRELRGVIPPRKIFTHVVGTDIIRDGEGRYLVLEDNC